MCLVGGRRSETSRHDDDETGAQVPVKRRACQPGGRCWCCTRWFAGFAAGTVEGGVHVGPHADVFGGRAAEGDFTSRRRRNWRTLVPVKRRVLQHFLHSTFVQGLRAKCARVLLGGGCTLQRGKGPLTSCACVQTSRKQRWASTDVHWAPVQRHVVVTMRVAPRS